MSSKRCTNCAENIQWAALSCRYCGYDQPPPVGEEPMSPAKKGCLWLAGIAVFLLLLIFAGPKDPKVVAMQKCEEKVYFPVGGSMDKLGTEEKWQCIQDVINSSNAASGQ